MDPAALLAEIRNWPVDKQYEFAQELWGHLDESQADPLGPLSQDEGKEIDRRLAAHGAKPEAALAWEQVEAEILDRLGR